MRLNLSSLTRIIAVAALLADAGITQSFAQTTMEPVPNTGASSTQSARRPARHRRVRPTASASSRNEGPASSVTGNGYNDTGNGNSGLPRNPGAPAASGTGATGGH